MLCSFKKPILPRSLDQLKDGEYMVAVYELQEPLPDKNGIPVTEAKVVGHFLPTVDGLHYDMTGHWKNHPKHGTQYEMETYREVVKRERNSIMRYLTCGLIKGIDPKTAEKIYDAFGDDTLEVLDKEPDKLLSIQGVSSKKLKAIHQSYLVSRGARNAVAFLVPHGISAKQAVKAYTMFGASTVDIIKKNPYELCIFRDIKFTITDKLAESINYPPLGSERLRAGLLQTLRNWERKGNLCMNKDALIRQSANLLRTQGLTVELLANEAFEMLKRGDLKLYGDYVYRDEMARLEQNVAYGVCELLSFGKKPFTLNLDNIIRELELKWKIALDIEQRNAIKLCLTSHISIITGGPGTGKTQIQKFILEIYKRAFPSAKIMCCAPTGRAARRMTQSTGHPAFTAHKAMGLTPDDNGEYGEPVKIDADIVLVDEGSMLDINTACSLFSALSYGAQLVLIGDADQLPSVGPGAVLSELIACKKIPLVKLDKVYRQASGSRVAKNARLIRHGNTALEYGDDFTLFESPTFDESAVIIEKIFLNEVKLYGIDNVALLTPFRYKTETGVNALNERIRDKINPPSEDKLEISHAGRVFRIGDKVMQTQNVDEINNGDVGYVVKIEPQGDSCMYVDFGDGRIAEYDKSSLDQLDWAYATTVHKSQGSEYISVIINLQDGHREMLKRPLVYTAITRAKDRALIVGDRSALFKAINTVDTEKRNTMLNYRIQETLALAS